MFPPECGTNRGTSPPRRCLIPPVSWLFAAVGSGLPIRWLVLCPAVLALGRAGCRSELGGDARAVLAQQLGDSRWRREAAAALSEQQKREQEAREQAEREAAEAAAAAAEWWSTVDAEDLADAYLQEQSRRAAEWVRKVEAGYDPERVAEAAGQRFTVDTPADQLAEAYTAVVRRREDSVVGWLREFGAALDEEGRAEAGADGYGLTPQLADRLVDDFDADQASRAAQWAGDLPEETPHVQALQLAVAKWGNTRYLNDALAALTAGQEQETQERETPERGRGGIDYGL